jgi:phage shock protein A
MPANPWELYECHKQFRTAHNALEKAWERAKKLAPELPAHERANLAERHVYETMKKYSEAGAMDSEPFHELRHRVEKHFGTRGDYL